MRPKMMLRRALIVPALMAMLYQPPVQAVFGVGDISFDPTVYAELISIYEQGKQLFDTAKKQLDNLAEIQRTINEANRAYQSVVNTDLKKIASDLQLRNPQGSDNPYAALRSELDRTESTLGSNTRYYQYQSQRIKNLESLELLQKVSTSNVERASGNEVNQNTSAQISAQSTSTLAALAAAEEQRRVEEDMGREHARRTEKEALTSTGSIYKAIGAQK